MHLSHCVCGLLVLALAAGQVAPGGGDDKKPAGPPKEESVVPYDSKTHGAVQVKTVSEKTNDWFDVLQNGKSVVGTQAHLLHGTVVLPPGAYVVTVNRTERKVTIEAGKKTVLWTGELVVEGAKGSGDWYEPYQGKQRMLARIPSVLNSPTPLFAGRYTVKVIRANKAAQDLGEVEVKAGQRTVLKSP